MLMTIITRLLPYLIFTTLTIVWWKAATWTSNYAWFPNGKELLMLDISLTTIFIYKLLFWLTVGNLGLFAIINSVKEKPIFAMGAAILTISIFLIGGQWVNKKLAFSYFAVFKNQSVTEEYIEEPILESGYYIGGKLIEYIQDKSVKYRRYAISGLGKIRYKPGTTTLRHILVDTNEPDYIRADALEALKSIGTSETKKIIDDFQKNW